MKNKFKQTMTALCAALILMGGFSVPAYAQGAATEPPAEDATNDSSPFEKMMIQKPDYGKREKSPPELSFPRCAGCPYKGQSPCVGYCIRKLIANKY